MVESGRNDSDIHNTLAVIKVIGVGSGGRNAVNHMVEATIKGVDLICVDTDAQELKGARAKPPLQLGSSITNGRGAGANSAEGQQATLRDREGIAETLAGADMVIIIGIGGGTGTEAALVVAEVAKELGILTVAVVTKPLPFEGSRRRHIAEDGIAELAKYVDSLITIPNEKLLAELGKDLILIGGCASANDIFLTAIRGIADLITCHGLIGIDFADVTTVLSDMGIAMVGTGSAVGPERAREAAKAAIHCPLFKDIDFAVAKGMLVTITVGCSFTMAEFDEVSNMVRDIANDDAIVVIGNVFDLDLEDELRVTIVATGLDDRLISAMRHDEIARRHSIYRMGPTAGGNAVEAADNELDYLDIPAFLRRPAD